VLDSIGTILQAHGATLADVVNVRTYLTDMSRLDEYAAAPRGRFGEMPPTSTTVEVSALFMPGLLVEVEVTAVV
jgi:2-iminobutanoate/2-iminopropanoate deaminase